MNRENMLATLLLFSAAFLIFALGTCCLIRGMRRRRW